MCDTSPKRGAVYPSLERALFTLEKYAGRLKSQFLGVLDERSNAKIFAENFFRMDTANHFLKHLNKHKKDAGLDKDKDKTYDMVDDDKLEKIDKFMKETLEALFKGITIDGIGNSDEIKKKISKLIPTKSNVGDLFKLWNDNLSKTFHDKIGEAGYSFKKSAGGFDNFDLIKRDGTTIPIKDFNKKYIENEENKNNVEYILNYLEVALNRKKPWKDDSMFKNLLEINNALLLKDEKSDDSDDDKKFEGGEKFKGHPSDIEFQMHDAINELLGSDGIGQVEAILTTIGDGELIADSLTGAKSVIIEYLKAIGINLSKYREICKTTWDDDDLKRHKDNIKSLIKRWNGNLTNKGKLRELIRDTETHINALK